MLKNKNTNDDKNSSDCKALHFLALAAKNTLLFVFILLVAFFVYINLPVKENNSPTPLGVTFSARYATDIGLDWREAYLAMLDDLSVRDIRIPVYWDMVEAEKGIYDFDELDWQMNEAQKRGARVTLAVGQKVPRWPECFIPAWAGQENDRKLSLPLFVAETVKRYRDHAALSRWQIENEPFLTFGVCPKLDVELLDREVDIVKLLDPHHKTVLTDSGELSIWKHAAERADIFGTTMYRTIYSAKHGYIRYPIGPNFFRLKGKLMDWLVGQKNVIVIELQGEPWIDGWTTNAPLEKQFASMNAEILADNVAFAKKTDFSEIYLWGVEWWYWLKVNHNDPSLWQQAKYLMIVNNRK